MHKGCCGQSEVYEARGTCAGVDGSVRRLVQAEVYEAGVTSDTYGRLETAASTKRCTLPCNTVNFLSSLTPSCPNTDTASWQATFALEQMVATLRTALRSTADARLTAGAEQRCTANKDSMSAADGLDELERQLNTILLAYEDNHQGDKETPTKADTRAERAGPVLSASMSSAQDGLRNLLHMQPSLQQLKCTIDSVEALMMLTNELIPQGNHVSLYRAAVTTSQYLDQAERRVAELELGVHEMRKACAEVRVVTDDVAQLYARRAT